MDTLNKLGPFENWEKPTWDECFMGMAYLIAMMSPDPNTKNGAVIVDKFKHLHALGFNGFPPNCYDDEMPRNRPDKYDFIEHAEKNALNNRMTDVTGMTMYVTGYPCKSCFLTIRCNRIKKVIYDSNNLAHCVSSKDVQVIKKLNKCPSEHKVELIPFEGDFSICMKRAMEYYEIKQKEKK
jgi:deoxycytidylate deaminase